MTSRSSGRCFRSGPLPRFGGNIRSRTGRKIHQELQTHKDLTLQLVWQEGRESNPDGYGYSRYVAAVFMLREHLKAMTVPGTGNVLAT